jgi:hypothetical protein
MASQVAMKVRVRRALGETTYLQARLGQVTLFYAAGVVG